MPHYDVVNGNRFNEQGRAEYAGQDPEIEPSSDFSSTEPVSLEFLSPLGGPRIIVKGKMNPLRIMLWSCSSIGTEFYKSLSAQSCRGIN